MTDRYNFFSNLIFAFTSIVLAICFLTFPIPSKIELKNYRISLKILAGAYFTLAALTILILGFNLNDNSTEPLTFVSLLISSSQALLFTFTLIILFNPNYINKQFVFRLLFPLGVITVLYTFSFILFGDPAILSVSAFWKNICHPSIAIRGIFLLFYIYQLINYTILFYKEEKKYKEKLSNYFSDLLHLQLPWVRYAFIAAFSIGTLSLIFTFFPSKVLDNISTCTFLTFYLFYAIEYIKYPNIYKLVEPMMHISETAQATQPVKARIQHYWPYYKKIIIDKKLFLREGINIEEMAQYLNIGRTTLSGYINNQENQNFNTFINTLRIEEAKQIIIHFPQIPIFQLSEHTGYSEQANFSRQFKLLTGESPSTWKQKSVASVDPDR